MLSTIDPLSQDQRATDTTRGEVLDWLWRQGKYNTAVEQVLLAYLSMNAFYTSKNPENGAVGQVLFFKSSFSEISEGTGIKSRDTIRRTLNSLQSKAYALRAWRANPTEPQKILVLWWASDLQEMARNAPAELPDIFERMPKQRNPPPSRGGLRLILGEQGSN